MTQTVAIIDYGSGNLHSAAKAFERAAREQDSKLSIKVTAEPEEVLSAERVVLPGVGAFADCKAGLAAVSGMIEALEEAAADKAVQSMMPTQIMSTLAQMHRLIERRE
mgnify:CR=1 FL=1